MDEVLIRLIGDGASVSISNELEIEGEMESTKVTPVLNFAMALMTVGKYALKSPEYKRELNALTDKYIARFGEDKEGANG